MTQSYRFQDLVQAAGEAFTLFPKDTYDAMVHSAEPATAQGGNDVVKVRFKVTTGPWSQTQSTIRNNFNIIPDNPQSLSFFFQHMEAMGLPREWFAANNPTVAQICQALVGRHCRIVVNDQRMYNDRPQNDVTDVLPPATGVTGVAPQIATYGVPQGYGMQQQPMMQQPMVPNPQQQFANASYSPQTALPQAPQQQFPPQPQMAPPAPAPQAQPQVPQQPAVAPAPAAPMTPPPPPGPQFQAPQLPFAMPGMQPQQPPQYEQPAAAPPPQPQFQQAPPPQAPPPLPQQPAYPQQPPQPQYAQPPYGNSQQPQQPQPGQQIPPPPDQSGLPF